MNRLLKIGSILFLGGFVFAAEFLVRDHLDWYGIIVSILALLVMVEVKWLSSLSFKSLGLWCQVISPLFFLMSGLAFFLLLSSQLGQVIFFIIISLVLMIYFYNVWLFYGDPGRYQAFTLENFSWYLNITTSWLALSSIFGLIVFINLPLLFAVLFVILINFGLFYQLWWIHKLEARSFWLYGILTLLVGLETFLALRWLPFSFYVLAFWWTAVLYIFERIMIDMIKDRLSPRSIGRLTVTIIGIAILLTATTRWF